MADIVDSEYSEMNHSIKKIKEEMDISWPRSSAKHIPLPASRDSLVLNCCGKELF